MQEEGEGVGWDLNNPMATSTPPLPLPSAGWPEVCREWSIGEI
ncbi:unnamed protein product [Rodentolepis nana]|uniref:Uncharacterized protein n=1 Tax=Rodentolepis nana TaxID=102285 RepID=A0A0R3U016_RODNA|nr:unnamed protein product [Rodentolepis nana]